MGRTDKPMGRTDKPLGCTDKLMGRADNPMGRQPMKVFFKSKQVQTRQFRSGKVKKCQEKLKKTVQGN